MNRQRIGKHSIRFENPPVITHWASVAGKRESEGPLGCNFDYCAKDNYFSQSSWEKAECFMQEKALSILLDKARCFPNDIHMIYSGDLLNQCIGSSFPLMNADISHFGLYGACATMAEALILAAMSAAGGYSQRSVAMTSSNFAASERQYRFPLNYGGQRPPTTQWTVTGAGSVMVEPQGKGPKITGCTVGSVVSYQITDANHMGAAMAPAAYKTIRQHLEDFQADVADFDLIVTGDLGQVGKQLLMHLAQEDGLQLGGKLADCGTMIYDLTCQHVHSGGSGCGCSAVVLCAELLPRIISKQYKRILFCGTGALLSPLSVQQKLPIPGICHAVCIEEQV